MVGSGGWVPAPSTEEREMVVLLRTCPRLNLGWGTARFRLSMSFSVSSSFFCRESSRLRPADEGEDGSETTNTGSVDVVISFGVLGSERVGASIIIDYGSVELV